jgi:hypothetical protein
LYCQGQHARTHRTRRRSKPTGSPITIYGILAALSDPTRLNLTLHFKVVREAGLIQSRYEGRKKFVSLRRDLIDDIFPGMLDGLLYAVGASEKNS